MKAADLYAQLEKDFVKPGLTDEWFKYMAPIADFICESYKKTSIGLVCDNTPEVNKVYTAVFPSYDVLQEVINKGEQNIMLFLHHPSDWNLVKAPPVFHLMDRELLQVFREKRISIFNLHVPLDNFSEYSTSATLAKALDLTDLQPFFEYYGSLAAVYGKTNITTISEMRDKFSDAVDMKTIIHSFFRNLFFS